MRITREDGKVMGIGAWIFGLFAVLLAFSALWVAADAMNKSDEAKADAAQGGAPKVTLSDFKIEPSAISVASNGSLAVTNASTTTPHNLAVKGTSKKTKMLNAGESAVLSLKGLKNGTYTIYCQVPGHEAAGMKGTLTIGSGGGAQGTAQSGSTGYTAAQLKAGDAANNKLQAAGVTEYVNQLTDGPNTKGLGNQPLEPTILPDGTKEFKLTAEVVSWEVSKGHTVSAWTYNGTVPGPVIKVNSGDKVKVTVTNKLPQSTEVHFHGLETPNSEDGVPFVTNKGPITPGQTRSYSFVAKGPAVGMYHSHYHAQNQVPDGMAGAFLVGDEPVPAGYAAPSQVVPMVLNDAGSIGLSLNGKAFPSTLPIIAKPGEVVEVHYYNEGLQIHPMHLHGIPQLVIAKDGFPVPAPDLEDTVLVAPGQRVTVLIRANADQTGVWAYHCHILNHAEGNDGLMGMTTTFIVQA